MSLAEEYKKSLKMAEAEEILDLIFYRPIAFVLVKLIYRLPITPNQMTYAALVAGIISAVQFGQGTETGFLWGAVWYAIANVLDCGDGMLARLQKRGTPLGRLVDGVVDWVSSVAIFYGLGMGMSAYFGNPLYWLLAIAAGVLSGYHAMVFDKRQQEYIAAVRGEHNFAECEQEKAQRERSETRSPLRRLVLSAYLWYMKAQQGSHRSEQPVRCTPSCYREQSKRIMRWWTWLGPTTNRTLLMIAGIVALPDWFCWFVIIPANIYLAGMVVWQRKVSRRLRDAADASAVGTTPIAA